MSDGLASPAVYELGKIVRCHPFVFNLSLCKGDDLKKKKSYFFHAIITKIK